MQSGPLTTDADRLVDQYRKIGEAEKHVYGQSAGGRPELQYQPQSTAGRRSACAAGGPGFAGDPGSGIAGNP